MQPRPIPRKRTRPRWRRCSRFSSTKLAERRAMAAGRFAKQGHQEFGSAAPDFYGGRRQSAYMLEALPRQRTTQMRGRSKPSKRRWLYGLAFAAPLLIVALVLKLAEYLDCETAKLTGLRCQAVPDAIYGSLLAAAAACLLYSLFRAYRDFVGGALERDLARWSGSLRRQKPVVADGAKATLHDEVSTAAIIPSADSKWTDEIGKEVGEILEKGDRKRPI